MPISVVRNLGIYMDADVSMRSHVSKTVAACFAILRQLQNIRRSVPRSVLQSLVSSLVLQRLYYGNATLAGISDTIIDLVIIIITQRHVKQEFLIDYFDRSKIHKTESNPPIQYQKLENS